ncbi:MAG TPA: MFS transporter [Gaiellaceae bacterium]|nr:MFS transporter [Gaiellaceae bacterium]
MRQHARFVAALFLVSLALRPQIIAAGPLIPAIKGDLGISHTVAGLLGTIPVLCMGLFAPAAAYVAGRIGARSAIGLSVTIVAVGGLLRVSTASTAVLIAFTLPVGIGIAIAGTLMPGAVKARLAHRPAFATGIYATGIQLGAAVSAALAVPLADLSGGWRLSLGVFAAAAALSAAAWFALSGREERPRAAVRPLRLPLRNRTAWSVSLVFAMIAVCFYGLSAWLPDAYVEHGWSDGRAGALLAVLQAATVPAGLALPWLADRHGSRRTYLASAAAVQICGLLGVQLAPGAGWLWAVVLGLSIGTLFPLAMTLPLDLSDNAAQAGAVTGMMLGIGYSITGLAPLVLGLVRDATGSFSTSLWLIVGIEACLFMSTLWLTHERLHAGALRGQPATP